MPSFTPKLPPSVRRLFRLPPSRASVLRDLDDEMHAHLAMRVDELRALGMGDAEALAEARRRFGDPDAFRDYAERRAARRARRLGAAQWLAEWAQDLRFARRQFAKARGFAALAVVTLALGIGANTAIFSVVHRLLLAPLPYPNGDRIVMPMQQADDGLVGPNLRGGEVRRVRSADSTTVSAWRARARTVDEIAGAELFSRFSVRRDETVDSIMPGGMTPNFLRVLGVRPALGRDFTPDDVRPDAPRVAMLGHDVWRLNFGGRADVVGAVVDIDGEPRTVVGVLPPGISVPLSREPTPGYWMPIPLEQVFDGPGFVGTPKLFARLRPGATADDATRELQALAASLPGAEQRPAVSAMRAEEFLDARERRAVQILFFAVGALLLIACANVANLLLARAWTRQREFAVRMSLGAGRGRVARQVLAESLLLALAGGALGVAIAWLTLRVVVALRPPALDHLADVRLAPAVLLWSFGVSVATGILFGCGPALFARARRVGDLLRRESRGASAGTSAARVRGALIVLEVAASIVLLVGSGLLVRSFVALQRVPLGFEPRGLVYVEIIAGTNARDRVPALRDAIFERLRAVPGVTDVAVGMLPGAGWAGGGLEAEPNGDGGRRVDVAGTNFISPDYFRVARIRLVEGRLPDPASAPALVPGRPMGLSGEIVLSRELARRLWPNGGAVGSRVRHLERRPPGVRPPPSAGPGPWSTVVGVVDDARLPGLRGDQRRLQMYTLPRTSFRNVPILVRTARSGDVMRPVVKRAVAAVDPRLVVRETASGDAYLRDALAPSRFAMALLTAFAVVALLLSAVGLYGVIAYGVGQRAREIGVRVALGARPAAVAGLVLRGGLRLTTLGVAVGVAVAAATTRVLESMLYGVTPADPITFAAIAALVAAIALVATWVPARRALRIDPVETLRAD